MSSYFVLSFYTSTVEHLITDLSFAGAHFIRLLPESQEQLVFPQFADVKAPIADDKAPLANNESPFMRLCRCLNVLRTRKQQCLDWFRERWLN